MIQTRVHPVLIFLALVLALTAMGCGGGAEHAEHVEEAAPPPPAEAAEVDTSPRIFFVEPAENASVTSPVHFEFGAENFTIEPRVEGEVNPGAGHHHIAIDGHCLPPGEIIPAAEPWVHFGDGSSSIDVQLTPGTHHLSIQVGDGDHRTLADEGLCAMMDVEVVEAE